MLLVLKRLNISTINVHIELCHCLLINNTHQITFDKKLIHWQNKLRSRSLCYCIIFQQMIEINRNNKKIIHNKSIHILFEEEMFRKFKCIQLNW